MNISVLKKIGFSDKSAQVYLALLRLGPSSVRSLAEETGLNRGTAYDMLKQLQEQRVVTFYKKDTKQQFVAEAPEKLQTLLRDRQEELSRTESDLSKFVTELEALHHSGKTKPVARYYGKAELHKILEDVLATTETSEEKLYRVYSTEGVREYLYADFPTFSDVRVAKGITVKAIALGDGGELRGLDERKWLGTLDTNPSQPPLKGEEKINPSPTYIILYPGKTAYIALDKHGEPMGVVIENPGVASMQEIIFDQLWETL